VKRRPPTTEYPLYKNPYTSKFFYSPTDEQVNGLKNSLKTYIKIDIKTAPTGFDAVTPP
jgi:hypothetical protein